MKTKLITLFLVLLFCLTISGAEIDDIINKSILEGKRIKNAPFKVHYIFEEKLFYPRNKITKILSDGKVEVEMKEMRTRNKDGESIPTKSILDYSDEYKSAYSFTKRNTRLYWFGDKSKLVEYWGTSKPTVIEIYDGKQTKVFFEPEYLDPRKNEKFTKKYGKIYNEKLLAPKFPRFYPFEVWQKFEVIPNKYYYTKKDNGDYCIDASDKIHNKGEVLISEKNNFMVHSVDFEINNHPYQSRKVLKTVKIKDFILPEEVELMEFDKEMFPEVYKHFYDFTYQILSEQKFQSEMSFNYPPGTKMDHLPLLDDLNLNSLKQKGNP